MSAVTRTEECPSRCETTGNGTPPSSIWDAIAADRTPYYRALEGADEALQSGRIDLTQMEELLSDMLAKQLVAVHEDARSEHL